MDFSGLPRWWYFDNPWLTHSANGLNLLFPMGERFFIRSVKHYLDDIDDPQLVERVRGFFGQEVQHGRAHEAMYAMLEEHGFEVQSFLSWYEKVAYELIEPMSPPGLRLSVTVAMEHLTAMLGERALAETHFDHVHASIRDTLRWHACEEIEHKDVAYDVFQEVDGRYWLRVVGMFVALGLLLFFWGNAQRHLLKQEGMSRTELRKHRSLAIRQVESPPLLRDGLLPYLRRRFHPNQIDNRGIAAAWLLKRQRSAA